ncbi:MAG: class D sortase [Candidatus Blackburnbacteria bacterium]|nr:class D sortase [Candidatus Blackburnbacteria bacterium]
MRKSRVGKTLSFGLFILGAILVLNAGLPILSYEFFSSPRYRRIELLSPVPNGEVRSAATESPYPLNLTQASNWFVGAPSLPVAPSKVRYYNLSIPKLKIEQAVVEIGGEDLSKNLIHYKGTALPGKPGNAVVFGHSTLPQLFNPKNYLSIFSTLPTLKKGDDVKIDYDGIVYTFRVEEMFEVKPTDFQVLEQMYDDSYLTLITCVPPGTYLRRLVVRARLVQPD